MEFVVRANGGVISVIGRTMKEDIQQVSEIREMKEGSKLIILGRR